MKILVVSEKVPYPLTDGASLCVYNIFKRLSEKHEIYLISFYEDPRDYENLVHINKIFKEIYLVKSDKTKKSIFNFMKSLILWNSGFLLKVQNPKLYKSFRLKMMEIVISKKIDLVNCVTPFMAEFSYDIAECFKVLQLIDSNTLTLKRKKSFQDTLKWHKKLHNLIWYYRFRNYEKRMINSFDASITVGKKDYEVLKTLSPHANVALIPNGVDTDFFYPLAKEYSDYLILLFHGNMSFLPNIDAVLYFYNDIFPFVRSKIPDIRLYIVGASPPEKIKRLSNDANVVVTGYVDDIRTYIAKADIVICPMRMGGGIKNKILEAMSSERVVISTSVGAEGIDAINRENILISNSPGDFAENIMAILSNNELRNKITKNARKFINENYTWDICSGRYEKLYANLLRTAE